MVCPHFDSPAAMNWSMITWAELSKSPNCASQRIRLSGRRRRVPVLEAERRVLRQRAVVDLERRQRAREVLDRGVLEAGLLVVKNEVAVGERPALGVLAGEPDVGSLGQKRRVGERLGVPVLDRPVVEDLDPALERLAQLAVDGEAVGEPDQLLVQGPDALLGDLGLDLGALGAIELPGSTGDGRILELPRLDLRPQGLEDSAQLVAALVTVALDLLGADDARRRRVAGRRSR